MTADRLEWQLGAIGKHLAGNPAPKNLPIYIGTSERNVLVTHVSLVRVGDEVYIRLDSELNLHGGTFGS